MLRAEQVWTSGLVLCALDLPADENGPWQQRRPEARSWGNPRAAEAAIVARAAKNIQPPPPEVLKLITDWRDQGRGLRDITRELNRLNIRTPQGCQWYASTVRAQLV